MTDAMFFNQSDKIRSGLQFHAVLHCFISFLHHTKLILNCDLSKLDTPSTPKKNVIVFADIFEAARL